MVELEDERLDAVFHALADSTRRTMLQLLAHGEYRSLDLSPLSFQRILDNRPLREKNII